MSRKEKIALDKEELVRIALKLKIAKMCTENKEYLQKCDKNISKNCKNVIKIQKQIAKT